VWVAHGARQAYGAEAVHTLVTRGLAVAVCLAYRQLSERSMGPGIFRHRKIDSMVFLPILCVAWPGGSAVPLLSHVDL
jgi:hypothetical protein